MQRRHLSMLVMPGTLLLAVLAGGIGAVLYARGEVDQAESRRVVQAQQLSTARARLANAGVEKEIITRFSKAYEALQEVGFVGAEQRLNWVDSLRSVNREAHLYGVEYQIGQQVPFAAAAEYGAAGLPMRQSPMKLRLTLLHEGDLMPFFRQLAARRTGVFTINACTLVRMNNPAGAADQPNVNADCELSWLTVEDIEPGVPPS